MTYLQTVWENEHKRPFYLINKRSERSHLLQLTAEQRDSILRFCTSGIPIFMTDPQNTLKFPDGQFSGNYEVLEEVPVEYGTYRFRAWEDVEANYKELEAIAKTSRLQIGNLRLSQN